MKNAVMVIVCVVVAVVTITASAFVTVKVRNANDARIAADTTTVETTSEKEEKTNAVTTQPETTAQQTTKQTTTQQATIQQTTAGQKTTSTKAQNKTNGSKLQYNRAYYNNSIEYLKGGSYYDFPRITFREDGTFVLEENMYLEGWVTYSGKYSVSGDTVSCDFLEYRVQEHDYENNQSIDESGDIKDSKGDIDHVEFKIEDDKLIIDRDLYTTQKGNAFVLN